MYYTPEEGASWDRVIDMIRRDMTEPSQRAIFNLWIKPLKLYAATQDTLFISGDNAFNLMHMKSRFATVIYSTVPLFFGHTYELEFYPEDEIAVHYAAARKSVLNPRYTFGNFIVGASNSFAFAASLAVAQNPSEVYNPLFIYGGVGLGKTHLMNAIGNYIVQENKNMNVMLMSSEAMTNELIDAIARKKTRDLHARLRNVDVLMVDDIQFISKAKVTQEEFFHTFNELHDRKKQIIIASDRPPKEIPELEERLRSRFEWGLLVDIQKPDYETRVAILKQKVDELGIDVDLDVLEYIAENVKSNIRELEGCLTSLDAHAQLLDVPITMDIARSALAGRIGPEAARLLTPQLVIELVAEQFDVTVDDLTGKKRNREIALPRQVAMYLCRELIGLSTPAIGQLFGGRDHTTVMHGCEKISSTMKADFDFKRRVDTLIDKAKNN